MKTNTATAVCVGLICATILIVTGHGEALVIIGLIVFMLAMAGAI